MTSWRIIPYVLVVFLVTGGCAILKGRGESADPERVLHNIVDDIKRSIAFVQVQTQVEGVRYEGTAFLIAKYNRLHILAACRHTFFDTSNFRDTVIIPDTARIRIKFHSHDKSYKGQVLIEQLKRDIAILGVIVDEGTLKSLDLAPVQFATAPEIMDGVEVACTGYDLTQKWDRFNQTYHWLTTHRGIISCTFAIGPKADYKFVDLFQVDMLINKGSSGAPVYLAADGRIVGMNKGFKGQEKGGLLVNYGLANCVPAWAIMKLFNEWRRSIQTSDTTSNLQKSEA